MELGRGVHDKIATYRDEYHAIVLPFYLGEVRKAGSRGAQELLSSKLDDLHGLGNPFIREGARRDPLRFFGMAALRQDLREILRTGGIVALYGLPATGKSAILQRIEYELPDARFVRIDCRGIATREALAAAIRGFLPASSLPRLAPPGNPSASDHDAPDPLVEALDSVMEARQVVLCLDDADELIRPMEEIGPGDDAFPQREADLRQALDLWSTLAVRAIAGRLTVVCTAPRAFVLGDRLIGGQVNALGNRVHPLRMSGLSPGEARNAVERLAGEARMRFEVDPID